MTEHGFEFTPMGPVAIGKGQEVFQGIDAERVTGNATTAEIAAFEARLGQAVRVLSAPEPSASVAPPRPTLALSPRDLIRDAKARIKALDAEIRRLTALRRERDELQRLVDAAKLKPVAKVRPIRSVNG